MSPANNHMSSDSKYTILGYDRMAVEKCEGYTSDITGWSAERTADTIRDAKKQAKHILSEAFRVSCEMSERLVYASIHLGGERGECVHEVWNPDYQLPSEKMFDCLAVLRALVRTIDNTGGVFLDDYGIPAGCFADVDWLDLSHVYMDACDQLGHAPKIAKAATEEVH